jgi:hypothetical protein
MTDYIRKGYIVPAKDVVTTKTWYLPHHPVQNLNKPGKVRVVFDCAAKYEGKCLNDYLLQGPDLVNDLVGVLLRFRQDKFAMMADIEQIYYQVRVPKNNKEVFRVLWWPGGGQWPLGLVTEVNTGRDGNIRSCRVRTSKSSLVRPITKLCLLEASD